MLANMVSFMTQDEPTHKKLCQDLSNSKIKPYQSHWSTAVPIKNMVRHSGAYFIIDLIFWNIFFITFFSFQTTRLGLEPKTTPKRIKPFFWVALPTELSGIIGKKHKNTKMFQIFISKINNDPTKNVYFNGHHTPCLITHTLLHNHMLLDRLPDRIFSLANGHLSVYQQVIVDFHSPPSIIEKDPRFEIMQLDR